MNIPDKVKIGFKNYEVNMVDGDVTEGNSVCYGVIHFDDGIIDISKKYSRDMQECSLIHECVHGIDDIFGIDLSEDQIIKLGKGIYGFIKDNPQLFVKPSNEIKPNIDVDKLVDNASHKFCEKLREAFNKSFK